MEEEVKKQKEREKEKERQRKLEQEQLNRYDYSTGFDHGFQRYDTNSQPHRQTEIKSQQKPNEGGSNPNDNEFDFSSFGNIEPPRQNTVVQKKKEEPTGQKIQDLDDLLNFDQPPAAAQGQPEQKNALDFFESNQIQFSNSPVKTTTDQSDPFGNSKPPVDVFGAGPSTGQQVQGAPS